MSVIPPHRRLDKVFSQFVRYRDCLKTTGTIESGACITCNWVYPYSQLQAGHFVSRTSYATRYDERNVNAQCVSCNVFKKGNIDEYFVRMEELYGREVVDELLSHKHTTRRFKRKEMKEMIDYYKAKIKEYI